MHLAMIGEFRYDQGSVRHGNAIEISSCEGNKMLPNPKNVQIPTCLGNLPLVLDEIISESNS